MKIIDVRARPNTPEYMSYFEQPRLKAKQKQKGLPPPPVQSLESFMAEAEAAGISAVVFTGRDNRSLGQWSVSNDYIAEVARTYPSRVIGVAGIDPPRPRAEVLAEIDRCVKELGLRGISMDVSRCRWAADDRRLYPIYERCIELDAPVFFTMGPSSRAPFYLELNSPILIDHVAVDLPDLKIVCGHGGWPFVLDMIAVAFRNENVYFDNSGYHFMPGASLLVEAANTILGNKIMYGSAHPFHPLKPTVDRFLQMPFKPEVLENVMYRNAARLLKLEG